MDEVRKGRSPLIAVLVAVVAGVALFAVAGLYLNRPPDVARALERLSSEMNKRLPMTVDKETRWESSAPGPDKLLSYRYTLVNFEGADVPKDALAEIRTRALANYKTNPAMKSLREMDVTLRYQYNNKAGVPAGEFSISPKDF